MHERRAPLGRDDGFTLIELMIVVLIIGILTAIALPQFLGARDRAQDNAAKQDLRSSVTVTKAIYASTGDHLGLTFTDMQAAEPAIDYRGPAVVSAGGNDFAVSVAVYTTVLDPAYSEVNMARTSESGRCYYARVIEIQSAAVPSDAPGTYYGWRAIPGTCSGTTVSGFATNTTSFPGW